MRVLRVAVVVIGLVLSPHLAGAQEDVRIPEFRGPAVELMPEQKGPRRLIRFLTSPDYPPFQFLKPDQSPAGLNVDLARAICSDLDFPCTIQALPWDELLPALESGRGDALIAGFRPTAELRAKAELTRPYFRLPARFAVTKGGGLADITPAAIESKRIGVVAGTAHEAYLKAFFPKSDIVGFPDMESARAALKEKRVDALFADGAGLSLWLAGTASEDCCTFAGGPYLENRFFGEGLVIAVKKGDKRLRQDLDRTLDEIEEKGVFAELYLRWFPLGIF